MPPLSRHVMPWPLGSGISLLRALSTVTCTYLHISAHALQARVPATCQRFTMRLSLRTLLLASAAAALLVWSPRECCLPPSTTPAAALDALLAPIQMLCWLMRMLWQLMSTRTHLPRTCSVGRLGSALTASGRFDAAAAAPRVSRNRTRLPAQGCVVRGGRRKAEAERGEV